VTQQEVRHKRVRHWSRSAVTGFAIMSVLTLGLGALFFWTATLPGVGQSGGLFLDGVGALFALWGLAFVARASLPLLVLTTHTLHRPRLFKRAQIIPLDEVTGVGLVYRRVVGVSTSLAWLLFLWTTGDMPRSLGIAYQPTGWLDPPDEVRKKFLAKEPSATEQGRHVDSFHFRYNFNPVTQTDPDKVAATHAGRVAREIYDRVLAYQGPSGYLAVRADQKHVPASYSPTASTSSIFWSPDGEIGRSSHQPEPPPAGGSSGKPQPQPKRPGLLRQLQYRVRLVGRQFQRRRADVFRDMFR
jgi:hypothetical protein